jgi:hypothetical protein
MEEELKAVNDIEIEKKIAEAFEKLVGSGCKCKLVSRSYANPDKAIFKIEIRHIPIEDKIMEALSQEAAAKKPKE